MFFQDCHLRRLIRHHHNGFIDIQKSNLVNVMLSNWPTNVAPNARIQLLVTLDSIHLIAGIFFAFHIHRTIWQLQSFQ